MVKINLYNKIILFSKNVLLFFYCLNNIIKGKESQG